MTPGQQRRKDRQDEACRLQRADEKVHELEKEVKRLREALRRIRDVGPESGGYIGGTIRNIYKDALDGRGDDQ